ncbi:MAG TPA: cbb3-type cytochrome c oxidase subunit I, partial [Actinomycetota bacterium]|nr:cbb3-type cytochrome c oxidase subunit I [Actinomycetota bacterium]
AIVPHDAFQTDTYYIVAHFHYVLFGGAIFGLFSALYYWWPKMFGRLLSDGLGKLHFALMFIGFNMSFAPMHILGLQGMPRRYYTYPEGFGWEFWNAVSTIGALVIALSTVVFIVNVAISRRRGEEAGDDPWDARTLEWSISSPPPHYNFAEVPIVHSRDDWWHKKYVEVPEGTPARVFAGGAVDQVDEEEEEAHPHIHMPDPSYFPAFAAVGLPIMGYGAIYQNFLVVGFGALILILGLFGWVLEPPAEES